MPFETACNGPTPPSGPMVAVIQIAEESSLLDYDVAGSSVSVSIEGSGSPCSLASKARKRW